MVSQVLKLNYTVNPVNSITGESQNDVDFGNVLDISFDEIPLKGNKNYSLYNDMVISIRDARRKNIDEIDVTKSDLESLKNILISATENNPLLNRKVSFLTEIIEKTITDGIVEKEKPIEN